VPVSTKRSDRGTLATTMRKAPVQSWVVGTPPEALSASVFDGALVVCGGLAPVARLVERVRAVVEQIFGTADPQGAEARMAPDLFRRAVSQARKAVERDERANGHWLDTLAAIGYAPEDSYLDRLRLRVVPSREDLCSRVVAPLPAHRDSWGSGIMAQINWWLPLYPLGESRTMVVWPEAFRRPVANTSADWDYDALTAGTARDYPRLPVAARAPAEPGLPVLIEPDELLAFSAAHLHASAVDASGLSRYSLDTRTVWARDAALGRGAPNVDGAPRRAHWEWFARPGVLEAAHGRTAAIQDRGVSS
jgi:hypothetical protein